MQINDTHSFIQSLKTIFATKDDVKQFATKDDLKQFATKDDLKKFATKDDLKRFATKDDLKKFATKEDLKRFATKDDLKKFATKDDLKKLTKTFATKKDLEKFATKEDLKQFPTKEDVQASIRAMIMSVEFEERVRAIVNDVLDERLRFIPTREEFFSKMDELLTEVKAMREEQRLLVAQHSDIYDTLDNHEERIKALEKRHSSRPSPVSSSL